MGISITQTYAKVGIERTPSNLQMSSRLAKLELSQKHAKVNIQTELPKVIIDQSEAFASAGLKSYSELSREWAQLGHQNALEYIGKVSGDGDQMASIENGTDAIANISDRDSIVVYDWNIGFIPKTGPKFSVTGSVNIEAERNWEGVNNGVQGTYTPPNLEVNYTPSKLKFFLREYPSINIKYEGNNIDVRG